MKNKNATYILAILVVLLWSLIAIKIYNHLHKKKQNDPSLSLLSSSNVNGFKMDSIADLKLNYRDPFLKGNINIIPQQTTSENNYNKPFNIRRRINELNIKTNSDHNIVWPEIYFSGLILNEKTNEELGLVEINDVSYIIRKGDIINDISIDKIYSDSVIVTYQGQIKNIKRNK